MAQSVATDQPVPTNEREKVQSEGAVEIEDVVVTGTNIRGVRSVGSPTTIINRKAIEDSGLTSAAQVLATLPQIQGSSSFSSEQPAQANPYSGSPITGGGSLFNNESRGSSVDIRGLGPNATLVLVDGRRQAPTGTVASFSEANILPLAAIERIEVVTDGASAVYGSNAIAGVVNYITRKDFEGGELSARYSSNQLYDERGGSAVLGRAWTLKGGQPGRVMVSYDQSRRDRVSYAADPRIRSDLTRFGGADAIYSSFQQPAPSGAGYYIGQTCPPPRLFLPQFGICFNPDFTVGWMNQYFDVTGLTPAGAPTSTPSTGQFAANALRDVDALRDYIGQSDTRSANLYLNQQLTDRLDLYYQGSYASRKEVVRTFDVYDLNVTIASPFFPVDAPLGASAVTVPVGVALRPAVRSESQVHTLGGTWKGPADWRAEAYVSHAESNNSTLGRAGRAPDVDILNYLVASGSFNPFLGLTDEVRRAATFDGPGKEGSLSDARSTEAVLRANGPIMTLPAGLLRGSVGIQYSDIGNAYEYYTQGGQTCAGLTAPAVCAPLASVRDEGRSGDTGRTIAAAYAEIFVPVVSAEMAVPWMQGFDISLAARWEEYSDFGQTFNPRLGFTWDVNDAVALRGSWGTAFRAPNLVEMSANAIGYVGPATNNAGPQYGPVGVPTQVVIVGGGNPDLGPEESDNLTFGIDLQPVEGLRISATYYRIDYSNKIQAPSVGSFLSSPENGDLYAAFIQRIAAPNPAGCNPNDPSTWAPEIRAVLPADPRSDAVCAATLILDGRWANAARVVQDGVDVDVRYAWDTDVGAFDAGVSVSKILGIDEDIVEGRATTPEPLGRIFRPLDLRGRASFGWSRGPWKFTAFANYTPSYINDLPITPTGPNGPLPTLPVAKVPSWITADLGLAYSTPADADGFLRGVRIGLNVQNVTDEDPPVVLIGNQAFDARAHSLYGRTWTLQVTKAF